jgi:hypothetical protein
MTQVAKVVGLCVLGFAATFLVNLVFAAAGAAVGFFVYEPPPEKKLQFVVCHADREPRCAPRKSSSVPISSAHAPPGER